MRTAAPAFAGTEAGEGRLVDTNARGVVLIRKDALFAVSEPALRHGKVARFEADARPVEIFHFHAGEYQPFDERRPSPQDQRGFAFAGFAGEDGLARMARTIGDAAAFLHGALPIGSGRDDNRAFLRPDGIDGALQRAIALAGFRDGEGRLCLLPAILGEQGGGGNCGNREHAEKPGSPAGGAFRAERHLRNHEHFLYP